MNRLDSALRRVPLLYQYALRIQAHRVGYNRYRLAKQYLHGHGVEIGALHNPLRVGPGAQVAYIDRMTRKELQVEYPEMYEFHERFVNVDIVDNGEELSSIADGSLDFLIANHMLEHCENPLGTMRTHLKKLSHSGILYYAIPDKSRTFDRDRPLTAFNHLVQDDVNGPQASQEGHYLEFVRCVAPYTWLGERVRNEGDVVAEAARLMASAFSIHFHVWNSASLSDFLSQARDYLGNQFKVERMVRNGSEMLVVFKKC